MTSTVDNISDGRLIVGLGTGDKMSRDELLSYGYQFPSLDERVERLRETILILKAMWTSDESSFNGKYYNISHARNSPKPRQTPHPPIWIGGKHPKILDVVAEFADGWNYWELKKRTLEQRSRYLSAKCVEFRRNFEQIIKSWSGTLSHLSRTTKNRSKMVEKISFELQSEADAKAEYFIASFGPRAAGQIYEAFAEAVASLE
jgi:alkanesulfonate monooxygenase SsuD/methylene tetrahydromethanopterin reductase-like flavin-dependent oxidoreductase (luciferase family)